MSAVHRKFATAVCDEVDSDDPIVLVQDDHFALAPRMIRERLPRNDHHVLAHPWPSAERIGIRPWLEELQALSAAWIERGPADALERSARQ